MRSTARLALREFTVDDLDALVELNSDPEVMRYLTGGAPIPRTVLAEQTLPGYLLAYGQGFGHWTAISRTSGEFVGWFALTAAGTPGTAELGYRLRRSAWGHGYATEGGGALLEYGFVELGLDRIVANTMTVNRASRRVMSKLGLEFVRTWIGDFGEYIEGAEHGDVEYAITRDRWVATRPPGSR